MICTPVHLQLVDDHEFFTMEFSPTEFCSSNFTGWSHMEALS